MLVSGSGQESRFKIQGPEPQLDKKDTVFKQNLFLAKVDTQKERKRNLIQARHGMYGFFCVHSSDDCLAYCIYG